MSATDEEIFASALTETPEQTENVPEEPTEAPREPLLSQTRDDKGRFASRAPEAPEPVAEHPVEQPTGETDAKVPSWRLAEEAQRRREAEQGLADLRAEMRAIQQQQLAMQQQRQVPQQAPEPIDPFADPQGFAQSILQAQEQKLQQLQLQHSLQFARYAHKEVFDKAYDSFVEHTHRTRDNASYQRVMSSADPGEALVQWYRDQELHKELGGSDLKSFLTKQQEEWLKDPAVQAKVIEAFKATQQASAQPGNINLPPSLSRISSASPMQGELENFDGSQKAIFDYAMKR